MCYGKCLLFVVNVGIYDYKDVLLGLYVEGGCMLVLLNCVCGNLVVGNFLMQFNGVFVVYVDGYVVVCVIEVFKVEGKVVVLVMQFGLMLVIDGQFNVQFVDDFFSMKWCSGVCVILFMCVVFVVSEILVNFYIFVWLFCDGLGCCDVLYLDGSIL